MVTDVTVSRWSRLRRGLRGCCWLLLACVAAVVVIRLAGLDDGTYLALPVSGMPYLAVVSVLLLGASALLRGRALSVVAAALVVVQVVLLAPRFVAEGAEPAHAAGATVRVATSNTLQGRVDAGALVDLVRTQRVDVLAVQEFTPSAASTLAEAGLADLLPHHVLPGGADTALYSRLPLSRTGALAAPTTWRQAAASVRVGGREIRLVSVHTYFPAGDPDRWSRDLAALRTAARHNAVLLGDFNATLDHAPLRELLAAGLVDSHAELGEAWAPTWPTRGASPVPLLQLDHVLHGDALAATWAGEYELPGSDHRAVVAELRLTR